MLLSRETFLLSGGLDVTILKQSRRTIMIICRDTQNDHKVEDECTDEAEFLIQSDFTAGNTENVPSHKRRTDGIKRLRRHEKGTKKMFTETNTYNLSPLADPIAFENAPCRHFVNSITMSQGTFTMSNNDHGHAAFETLDLLNDLLFSFRIQGTC